MSQVRKVTEQIEKILVKTFDKILQQFYADIRKVDGTEYEPDFKDYGKFNQSIPEVIKLPCFDCFWQIIFVVKKGFGS